VLRSSGKEGSVAYDGSCIRLRPMRKDQVWSYNLLMDRTSDGRLLRILVIIDDYAWEHLLCTLPEGSDLRMSWIDCMNRT
jgi:hypothetical protein